MGGPVKYLIALFVFCVACNHATDRSEVPDAPAKTSPAPTKPADETPSAQGPETFPAPEVLKNLKPSEPALPTDGTSSLLLLSSLHLVVDEGQKPEGFYFRGIMQNGLFIPDGEGLQGNAPIPLGGTPGWLELHTAKFLPAMTSRAPAEPFIEGRLTPDGFFPSAQKRILKETKK